MEKFFVPFTKSDFVISLIRNVNDVLKSFGLPSITGETITIGIMVFFGTLIWYWFFFGDRHLRRRMKLAKDLAEARIHVLDLEKKLAEVKPKNDGRPIRIWVDGAFDLMHYGHMNAFRQAKALGTYLIAGINSSSSIESCKGSPPIMTDDERLVAVEACRFVDEVVADVPYVLDDAFLKHILNDLHVDFIVHGDDPCIANGRDVYEIPKRLNKFLTIPRTEGISTTDLVGRMLLMTKSHHTLQSDSRELIARRLSSAVDEDEGDSTTLSTRSNFLTTMHILRLFSYSVKPPPTSSSSVIIYLDGGWDLFHAGHVKLIKKARVELKADYVIVGIYNDSIVNMQKGGNLPIMNLQERTLSVCACKYVDDVVVDCPYKLTRETIASLRISLIVAGTVTDQPMKKKKKKKMSKANLQQQSESSGDGDDEDDIEQIDDPYEIPKQMGIFRQVISDSDMTVHSICDRIKANRATYEAKFAKKKKAEDEYYANRYQLNETK